MSDEQTNLIVGLKSVRGHMNINPDSWFPPLHPFQLSNCPAVLSPAQLLVSLMTSPGEICGLWCDFAEVAWFFEEHRYGSIQNAKTLNANDRVCKE